MTDCASELHPACRADMVDMVDTPRFLTRERISKVILGMSRWIAQRAKKSA